MVRERKDELYIKVPSFFRCPISLDIMKSPVSLSTGVTYDRSSIQRWLDGGNNTCPATMQVLQSKECVPNYTLQRLIQIWLDSVNKNNNLRHDSDAVNSVPTKDEIKCLVGEIETEKESDGIVESLVKIFSFGKESDENRGFLVKIDGFVSMLVGFLKNKEIELIEPAVRVLSMILDKIGDYKELNELILKNENDDLICVSSLLHVLENGKSVDSKIGSVKILESISMDGESKLLVAEFNGLLTALVKMVESDSDLSLIEACLSCMISISMTKRVKVKLVSLKIVKKLKKLLVEVTSVSITEKSLKLLETVSCCKEGIMEMCSEEGCVEAVVQKVMKVSAAAAEHAVMILWSVCFLFRDQRAQEAVNRCNGMTKLLLLMQSHCSPAVKQMCADLLKVFRVNSKSSCLESYDTKTTHIVPF